MVLGSLKATRAWGQAFAQRLVPGDVVSLVGDLGAGKTTLAQAIARGLGVTEAVTSPTYTLINVYEGAVPVVHMDLYRLSGPEEFELIGGWDALGPRSVTLVEWADRWGDDGPEHQWTVHLEVAGSGRRLTCQGHRDVGP